MVRKRGKKKPASSNKTLEDSETAENAFSLPVNAEERKADAQFVDKLDTTDGEVKNEEYEEIYGDEESEKATKDSDAKNTVVIEINGDNKAESERSTSEDDELDDQGDGMWEDEENYEDDNAFDEDEVIEEEATEEENDDEDEVGEEEPIEKEDDDKDEVSEEEGPEEEGNEENTQEEKEIAKGDGGEAKEHNTEKAEVSLRNIKKSSVKSRNNKVQAERLEKVDAKDKPESSRKRKVKKRVKSMGMIFMCSSKTKNDCYQYRVLGLPETKKDIVEKIYTGMRLFLYDVDLKLMYGIYKAAGPGGYNIEPKAFKSQFPSQVRFTILDDCLPLPEEKFKKVMKENYYTKTKFDCQLNSEQVKKLCKMFIASSKGSHSKKLGRTRNAEKHHPGPRGRISRHRAGDGTRISLREELRYHERPRKRPRKAISAVGPSRRPRAPLPSAVPLHVYEDPYLERHSPLRDRPNPLLNRRDPYRNGRDPYLDRHYSYREGSDPYIERRDPYRDGRDPYIGTRDPYRDGRDLYLKRHDSYRDGRDPYLERRDPYRDVPDPNIESRDSYRDERDLYLERRVIYRDDAHSEPYNTYRRDHLPVHHDDVYREAPVVEYRDPYRRDKLPYRREEVYPLSLETRHRHDISSRNPYVSKRERPSLAEPIYSAEYSSRPGLAREYRL